MDCRLAQKHLSAYVDGELEPSPMLEVEQHLGGCNECASQQLFFGAVKQELKRQLVPECSPAELRARVVRALSEVSLPVDPDEQPAGHVWITLGVIAASVLLVIGSMVGSDRPGVHFASATVGNPLDIVREVVDRHKDKLPAEISTPVPEKATSWFRDKVGFRVRTVEFAEPKVHFVGARMSQVGTHQAAKLYYSVGDSQLTLVMFKPSAPLEQLLNSEHDLDLAGVQRVRMSGREVPYRTLQGYTVPILHDNGIVYAFTGDLDQGNLLHLVATVRIPH
jgi:anti-sigma factor (TIGR02949 family)